MTDREFKELQAKILSTDTADNEYLPASTKASINKAFNTNKKDVVGAINELLEALIEKTETAPAPATPSAAPKLSVNSIKPDADGNVQIEMVLKAERDALNNRIDTTYATKTDITNLKKEWINSKDNSPILIKTINGLSPDSRGNFEFRIINKSVEADKAKCDIQGQNIIETYVTRKGLRQEINTLSEDVIHTVDGQKVIGGNLDLAGRLSAAMVDCLTKTDMKFFMKSTDMDEKLRSYNMIRKVNGAVPDANGNLTLDSIKNADFANRARSAEVADTARADEDGNKLKTTYLKIDDALRDYITKEDFDELKKDLSRQRQLDSRIDIKSINGKTPDSNGDIEVKEVENAHYAKKDSQGHILTDYYASKEYVTEQVVLVKQIVSGKESVYDMAVNNGLFEGTMEEFLESMRGVKGPKGDRGVQGIQGPRGEKGEPGDKVKINVKEIVLDCKFAQDLWNGNEYVYRNSNITSGQIIRFIPDGDDDEMAGISCKSQTDGELVLEALNGIPKNNAKFKLILQIIKNADITDEELGNKKIVCRKTLLSSEWEGFDYPLGLAEVKADSTVLIKLPVGASSIAHKIFANALIDVKEQNNGILTLAANGDIPSKDLEVEIVIF